MAFREIPKNVDFPAQERELLKFWQETNVFHRLHQLHENDPRWSFIDGPITANNPMGVHHGWGRTYKDLMQRFWAMRGHKLRYQNGFDCQGLWVEVEVEKELGFRNKKDIEAYGLEQFVRQCKARVLRFAAVQTEQSIRLGYWMDWNDPDQLRWLAERLMEDPLQVISVKGVSGPVTGSVEQIVGRLGLPELGGSYFTFSDENNYMIWTFLKKCWKKGWLYRGADVMPWCPRCETALSQHEIVTEGYAELTHPSVTLRFPLRGRHKEALLVWTTTPWTLSSNVAAAVGPDLNYARVRQGDEILYLSAGALHMLHGEYEMLGELRGEEMLGWTYAGPFDELPASQEAGGHTRMKKLVQGIEQNASQAHTVILWEEVGESEGTGIVHIAPGCGAEDFILGREHGLPIIAPLEENGVFVDSFGWLSGRHVAQVAELIFSDLEQKGLLYQVTPYTHRYPTCWRCKTELVFRLVDEWFISMGEVYNRPRQELTADQKARSLRYQIMDVVDQIHWFPDFGYAREMDWLRNMHDWLISKKRYWGLALPIWVCEACDHFEVIGDEGELQGRAISGWETFAGHTPHRPHIDAVKLACPVCRGQMRRIPDVGNPWLDAGVVPFSTLQYRKDREYWQAWYPADWISESFPGQFRNWFYSLLAMATVLDQSPPFLQNFGYATLLGEDGQEMHKSLGNSIEFNEAADQMGVDVMRWLFCSQKPENDLLFGYQRGDEARRRFLLPLWNAYSFFVTYANIDGWVPHPPGKNEKVFDPHNPSGSAPVSQALLDRWVLRRMEQVVTGVTANLEVSDFLTAAGTLEVFLDDLTNWYIRRSRRRFWKSEQDADKRMAYATLYYVLVRLALTLAPFTPFVAETIYQNLVRSVYPRAFESVHHCAWPLEVKQASEKLQVGENLREASMVLEQMALARQIASLGLSARSAAGLKIRQPLATILVHLGGTGLPVEEYWTPGNPISPAPLREIVMDELNVKEMEFVSDPRRLVTYRIQPDNKLLGPRFGAQFPRLRAALAAADPASIAASVQAGQPVILELDEQPVELAPGEILVHTQPVEGLAVAAEKLITVAIDTNITPELRAEGLARELVRRIQDMRKKAGFNIEDRIASYYVAGGELAQVMVNFANYICAETLSTALLPEQPPSDAYSEVQIVDGIELRLGVRRLANPAK